MREIKFRAHCKPDNRFYYFTIGQGNAVFNDRDIYNKLCLDGVAFEQFTGLLDKNGKEIYEGDIVKFEDVSGYKDGCASVIWHEDSCGYYLENDDDNIYDTLYDFTPSYQMEIIGNIHENPELLEATC